MDAAHFSDPEVLHYFQWPAGGNLYELKKKFDYKKNCAVSINLVTALKMCGKMTLLPN